LGTLAADLPDGVPAFDAADATDLLGTVTRAPMAELDLVRPSDVVAADRRGPPRARPGPGPGGAPRPLRGAGRAGQRVDVLATDPDGLGTVALATDVLVLDVESDDDADIGGTAGARYRLAAPDRATAVAIVDAAVRSQLTLVLPTAQSTGAASGG